MRSGFTKTTNQLLPIVTIAALATASNPLSAISVYSTDFENFALGGDYSGTNPLITDPSAGSNNWRGNGASGLADNGVPGSQYDGEIVDTGTPNGKAYRISNAKVSGNYDQTHAATPTLDKIGETGSGGVPGSFKFSFDFKAATSSLQDGLVVDVTPFLSGSSNRQGIIRISDNATDGLSIGWWGHDGGFVFSSLDTSLSRTDWHSVAVTMNFANGAGNDSVTVDVNGDTTSMLNTWEGFYSSIALPPQAVDSVIFRVASPVDFDTNAGGVAALDGGGIFIDNVYTESVVPEPSTYAAIAGLVGLIAAFGRRRLRS